MAALLYRDMKLEEAIKQTKFSSEQQKLTLNVMYTSAWIHEPIKKVLAEYKLTSPQYNILRILKGAKPEPISPADIKAVMLHKKSDLTRMLDRMVNKKIINRKVCPSNRRKMDITISNVGVELLDRIYPKLNKVTEDRIFSNLSAKEAQQANELLDKMRGQM